jgi:hypothetical protein
MLFMSEDQSINEIFDSFPNFLVQDTALFSTVVIFIIDPENLSDKFSEHLFDQSNIFTRATVKEEEDYINSFPFNVYFCKINNVEKFYATHLQYLYEKTYDQ